MRIIEAYQTIDGAVFTDSAEAKRHEAVLNFKNWYEDNECYGNYEGSKIEANDMVNWLIASRNHVEALYKDTI